MNESQRSSFREREFFHYLFTPFKKLSSIWRVALVAVTVLCIVLYASVYRAPGDFPVNTVFTISGGMTTGEISYLLEDKSYIRSSFAFRVFVTLLGGEKKIMAGDYVFHKKRGLGGISRALITGQFGLEPIRVTIPEGATVREIGNIISSKIESFNTEEFLTLADEKEGYLFPDTYTLQETAKAKDVIFLMENTFDRRISDIRADILRSGRPFDEVIVMASLLEKEAYLPDVRRVVAGILWKRLDEGIPLQVDAVFLYINGKNTFELTLDDLDIDSPYNTYRYRGLPPGPIANPGLDAILAAITPIETDYYYYLSDKEGITHYSQTFDEHKRKKQIYLN